MRLRLQNHILYIIIVIAFLVLTPSATLSQSGDAILFVWNDRLFAQPLAGGAIIATEKPYLRQTPPLPPQLSVTALANSPLTAPPLEGYGFYQGVWSPDASRFAYLAIQPDDAGYRVIGVEGGNQRVLFSGEVGRERGYLVPVGWAGDGALMLLERHMLHNLRGVRLWAYGESDASLTLRQSFDTPALHGNSITLDGEWVFVGFDTVGAGAYRVNINTGERQSFLSGFLLQDPPASVFETYPVVVLGRVDIAALAAWQPAPAEPTDALMRTPPFIHWPLPDDARSITCLPDSEWTDLQYPLECPGLTVPRAYIGHEGTDVGGKPDGLPIGTPVYAAAHGLVIKQFDGCPSGDVTCGDAYGNYVLLEHARVIAGEVETWFTGYAHLQAVLVEAYTYVRELGIPIAFSGDTGLGGAHLHFEVRSPEQPVPTNWIDPWDVRPTPDEAGLWLGGSAQPLSSVMAEPPPTLLICTTIDGNNIRVGPGTEYAVVTQTQAQIVYEVFQVRTLTSGGTPGDWYHLRWGDGATGWLWAELMTSCESVG
jgi:murein DD-endopeptidase MepM/ murein hydrolase activator NlpD